MRRNRSLERRIARERMEILMQLAEEVFHRDRKLARRYVQLARRIAMKYNLRFPAGWKRRFCRRCGSFLVPGVNLRVRCRKLRVIYTCLECGHVRRVPYAREKLQMRLQTLHTDA
ncbi:MAG: ribonuclease P [Euryarchaeota archaeon]|nr:ribonuclease P [Euryarchaeota archaeon]